ncbi:ABC-type molybdenum transport system ATPase subunit/photorepair protein PhrA [Lachnospiraceae bacterium PF1-21]|uniref:AAA family ATPase n=1 Tax=Ohessyouella blattaphilus TaxID=2949333 RepID=A0ABT1EGH7_9FIRM|nr:AAA family ATPase [Ohessyouella blattaphilus]MCP1109594.1 AAA family ATPase [Ohessyouella blattaphilus]MCR8562988.1 AAA family ATPase [Ohessyouella blattaphilus]
MLSKITLQTDRFNDTEISNLKAKNFFYGKNGTGKSSITEAISTQCEDNYDLHIFQGFNRIIEENNGLNTIALGIQNVKLQPLISEKKKDIEKLDDDLKERNDSIENTFTIYSKEQLNYNHLIGVIDRFFSASASEIKREYVELTGPNYNKNNFKEDVKSAEELSKEELFKYKTQFEQTSIEASEKMKFEALEVDSLVDEVNEILTTEVVKSAILKFESTEKMNWVREGLNFYGNENEEICLFCGNKIEATRLDDLNSFFSEEVKTIESKIRNLLENISIMKNALSQQKRVEKSSFYPDFHGEIPTINDQIDSVTKEHTRFLEEIESALKERQKDIFISQKALVLSKPSTYSEVEKIYLSLYKKNLKYGETLDSKIKEAKDMLRQHEVSKRLKEFDYQQKVNELKKTESLLNEAKSKYEMQSGKREEAKKELLALLSQTIDETVAEKRINEAIKSLGNQSFTLEGIESEQRGQYQVKSYDGTVRNIGTLSTGEKNIVAFLWFLNNLEKARQTDSKPKIIVFDDPMNSNDDTVQYLIITEIQKLIKDIRDDQIFILTHCTHFYLNARYNWWRNSKKDTYNKTTFHLKRVGNKSSIELITSERDDIKTNYDALWREVKFLYEEHKPDFMINPIRRIFETYQKFNGIDDLYKNDAESQKLFNVNSHSIDDLEADLNGKDEDAIISKVRQIFEANNAGEHFRTYWGEV